MKNSKQINALKTGIIIGLCGAMAATLSSFLMWPTWVLFLAWVCYYVFGKSVKASLTSFTRIVLGFSLGIAMFLSGQLLTTTLGVLAVPISIFILTALLGFSLTMLNKLHTIPFWFVGLIIFFGLHPKLEWLLLLESIIPIVAGFTFAWVNDSLINHFVAKEDTEKASSTRF